MLPCFVPKISPCPSTGWNTHMLESSSGGSSAGAPGLLAASSNGVALPNKTRCTQCQASSKCQASMCGCTMHQRQSSTTAEYTHHSANMLVNDLGRRTGLVDERVQCTLAIRTTGCCLVNLSSPAHKSDRHCEGRRHRQCIQCNRSLRLAAHTRTHQHWMFRGAKSSWSATASPT